MSQPTINDVARKAGVSKSLVSLVMRDAPNVSEERRKAVLQAAETLGYRPNAAARSLARRRSQLIGVMVSDVHNPFYAEVLDGVEEAAATAGYKVLMNSGQRIEAREEEAIETFLELRVDALILGSPRVPVPSLRRVANTVPVVSIGRASRASELDSVVTDERAGARLIIEHLRGLGHTRIAHIDGSTETGGLQRRRAYERAMTRADLEKHITVIEGEFTEDAGYQGARDLFTRSSPPTAVFAANDLSAIGAIQALGEMQIRVPRDVSVIGYDNTHLSALDHISLSTVNQPREAMGRRATQLLVERLEGGRTKARHVVVPPNLIPRSTTARVRRDKR